MARRRRISKVDFDTKIMMDVGMAGVATRILPIVVNKFIPLDPTLYTAVGAGGGYLTGVFLKNKYLANASISLGLVEFIAPIIENIVGGFVGGPTRQAFIEPAGPTGIHSSELKPEFQNVSDYLRLNDYVASPDNRMVNSVYRDSY